MTSFAIIYVWFYCSFCNLTTAFAVQINGVVAPNDLRDIAAANYSVLTIIILSLIGTYVWFHNKTVRKQKPANAIGRDRDGRLMDEGDNAQESNEYHEKYEWLYMYMSMWCSWCNYYGIFKAQHVLWVLIHWLCALYCYCGSSLRIYSMSMVCSDLSFQMHVWGVTADKKIC